ncbi:inner membrane-spanning protein YciB [Actibacterium sp. D379-3]
MKEEPMAEKKKINPIVKLGLEIGPILAFFAGYIALRDRSFSIGGSEYEGFILVTAGFIPLILLTTALLWKLSGHVSKMQIATAALVVVFGGLTVWLNDDRFFKMKPTMIYTLFAGVLGFGLLRGQSYLQYVMEEMMPLRPEGWKILTRRLMFFFIGLAVLNEVIWRSMSTDTWVNFKTFGLTIAVFAFFMTQGGLLQKYASDRDQS